MTRFRCGQIWLVHFDIPDVQSLKRAEENVRVFIFQRDAGGGTSRGRGT